MGTERKAVGTFNDHLLQQSRDMQQQQRRPQFYRASDLLGPGFGPTSTQLLDWNDEDATFNGFFWSPVGAINSPDGTVEWAGIAIAEDDRSFGVQNVYSVRSGSPVQKYTRRWSYGGDATTVQFSDWCGDSAWQTSGILVAGPCTLLNQAWKTSGHVVSVLAKVKLTALVDLSNPTTVSGNLMNTAMLQVPASIRPNAPDPLLLQPLSSGSTGPVTGWVIGSDGIITITAGPAVNPSLFVSGTELDLGGTYML